MVYLYFYADSTSEKYFKDHYSSIQYNYPENVLFFTCLNTFIAKINEQNKNEFFIFYQILPDSFKENYDKRIFVFNTEQLTRTNYLEYFLNLKNNHTDYSFSNIEILNLKKKNVFYLPYMANKNEVLNIQKTKDVCFIEGGPSPYRNNIVQKLRQNGVNIDIINGWERERDIKLFSYKILLNIHYNSEYRIFEQFRCNRCIMNKMIVISEKNIDTCFEMQKHMIETEYDDLVSTVKYVLSNYKSVHQNLFENFDIDEMEKKYKTIGDMFFSCLEDLSEN